MNLGLGSLLDLKQHILHEDLRAQTDYDLPLRNIGAGVAARFEKFCDRKFRRAEADVFQFRGDQEHTVLPRYPVETISAIETQEPYATTWTALTVADVIARFFPTSGLVYFGARLGTHLDEVRITYTGGFWWPDLDAEETEADKPAAATLLDSGLKLAWLMQCEHIWRNRDKLGVSIADKPETANSLAQLDLIPMVRDALLHYRRLVLLG